MSSESASRNANVVECLVLAVGGAWLIACLVLFALWAQGYDPEGSVYLRAAKYQDMLQGITAVASVIWIVFQVVLIEQSLAEHHLATTQGYKLLASCHKALVANLEATKELAGKIDQNDLDLMDDEDFFDDLEDEDDDEESGMIAGSVPDHGREGQSPIRTAY